MKNKKQKLIDKMTVQSYLDKYTSEDNASFEELAQLHFKKERVRNAWMYEAERKHNESLVHRTAPEALCDAADQQLVARQNGESMLLILFTLKNSSGIFTGDLSFFFEYLILFGYLLFYFKPVI